jgi:hypothetical protein
MRTPFSRLSLIVLLFLALLSSVSYAQNTRKNDVIKLRDNTKLEVVIKEVLESVIKYKKISDIDGPLFSVNKSDISSIEFGNGDIQNFEAALEVPNYYSPSAKTPPIAANPAPLPRNSFDEDILRASPEQLKTFHKYYKTRSKRGMVMGIAGVSIGVVVAGIGTGILTSVTDDKGHLINSQDEGKATAAAFMVLGGAVGAATFGTIGFVKAGKNGSKATRIRRELNRRGESISFKISPGYNAVNRAGYLTLNMTF